MSRHRRDTCKRRPSSVARASAASAATLFSFVLLADAAVSEPGEPRYLSAAELSSIASESQLAYEIRLSDHIEDAAPGGLAEAAWPTMGGGLEHPFVEETADGARSLVSYPLAEGCLEQLARGEEAFARQDYDEAGKTYGQAAEAFPDCYVAHLYVGDTFWHRREASEALVHYDRAAKLNPYTFQTHYFRANALLKLGRAQEAHAAYLRALALQPHRASIEQVLGLYSARLGAVFDPWRLEPRAVLHPSEKGMVIEVDAKAPAWSAYGLCRAVWSLEPGFRPATEAADGRTWSNGQEAQCLRAAVAAYHDARAAGEHRFDGTLEHLAAVDEAGLLDGLVFYEIAGRINPSVMVMLPDDAFSRVLRYLDRFVLTRR